MENTSPEFIRGKSYDAMSTASLYALLDHLMDDKREDTDAQAIDAILAVLNERTPHEPVDVDSAWDSFVHDYYTGDPLYPEQEEASSSSPESTTKQSEIQAKNQSSEKRSGKKHSVRMLLIAAVVVIALGAITASATNVWNAVLSWTSETFGLEFGARVNSAVQNPELSELTSALGEDGVTAQLIPKYLPEGYTQSEFYSDHFGYTAAYENGISTIIIQVHLIDSSTGIQMEKDGDDPEIYTTHNVDHYISTNMGQYSSIWHNDDYECSIMGVPSRKELIKMIDSIYPEE